MTTSLSRRMVLVASAAAASFGAAVVPSVAASTTPIAQLWAKAEALSFAMRSHSGEINKVDALGGGLPAWMRGSANLNSLGQQRYDVMVAILNSKPRNADDLTLMAKVAGSAEMKAGPQGWAMARIADATKALAA